MALLLRTRQRTRLLAGTIATLGCLLSIGGSLLLAEHYAQTGASEGGSGYYATILVRRSACPEVTTGRTVAASVLHGVENS